MTFEEAKNTFADSFKEAGGCNWDNTGEFVIGTNNKNVKVKVYEDSNDFCVLLKPYCIERWSGSLTAVKLGKASVEQIAELGKRTAKTCFDALARKEDN